MGGGAEGDIPATLTEETDMLALLILLAVALVLTLAWTGGLFGPVGGARRTTVLRRAPRRVVRQEVVEPVVTERVVTERVVRTERDPF